MEGRQPPPIAGTPVMDGDTFDPYPISFQDGDEVMYWPDTPDEIQVMLVPGSVGIVTWADPLPFPLQRVRIWWHGVPHPHGRNTNQETLGTPYGVQLVRRRAPKKE